MSGFEESASVHNLFVEEIATFEKLLPGLLETDLGRWALIKDSDFVGAYDTEGDAINVGYKDFGNVPFFVKQILEHQPIEFYGFAETEAA